MSIKNVCRCSNNIKNLHKKIFRQTLLILVLLIIMCFSWACSIEDKDEKKLNDVNFTVVPDENVPEPLKKTIEEKKKDMFKMTYKDQNSLYIVVGYGVQPTGGYSISVKELYETKNGIYIKTEFCGPSKTEDISQNSTYPYIVVKIEYTDKSVVFK